MGKLAKKKKPYTTSTGIIQCDGTRGKTTTITAAATKANVIQRFRPPSLRLPNSGLLIVAATKIPLNASPVHFGSKLCAFCRNSELRLPMLDPAKSRTLKAKQYASTKNHSAGEGNNLPAGSVFRSLAGACCSLSASQVKMAAPTMPRMPSSSTGLRQAAAPRSEERRVGQE